MDRHTSLAPTLASPGRICAASQCQGHLVECDSNLTCPGYVTKHNISSAGSAHHYCLSTAHINNRQYDSIQREDETQVTTQGSALDIDISSFTQCKYSGVMCGPDECSRSDLWCNEARADQCNTGSELIRTTDSRLCSNPEVWRGVDYDGAVPVWTYGTRCTRQNMEWFARARSIPTI